MSRILVWATLTAFVLSGCGSSHQERTAPCKRSSPLTGFVEHKRAGCGPMTRINDDHDEVVAAIYAIGGE